MSLQFPAVFGGFFTLAVLFNLAVYGLLIFLAFRAVESLARISDAFSEISRTLAQISIDLRGGKVNEP